ncbi:fibrillin-3-like isoform X1 [Labeo rohita]|uniref:Fibrillin-3-like isoform X1 n=1 Tax=Labeo rohita TaxID=84645 RepID=A0A498NWA6_LABRO|nr:fibrillin-3-like isoform X1 [Labeo rohita]
MTVLFLTNVDECNFEESCRRELGNVCVNTDGSYTCVCQTGFREDRAACLDVDECNFEESCRRELGNVCVNTDGSYTCVCQTGFREDRAACLAVTTPCVPPCQHGSICGPLNTCVCPTGTSGIRCEKLTCPVVTTVVSMARAVRKGFRESYVDRCGPLGVQLCTKYRINQARVYLQAYRVGYKIQCPDKTR